MRALLYIALTLVATWCSGQYVGGIGGGGDTNCGSQLAVLPVELVMFTATANGEVVTLQWATATEHNNAGFAIERSADGLTFEGIAELQGAGTSQQLMNYDAIDRSPLQGVSYYRLLQMDFDGTRNYSHVVSVTMDKSELLAYPNPAADQLWITGCRAGEEVTLIDGTGRAVYGGRAHDGTMVLEISGLAPVRYVVRVTGTGEARTLSIVKH